MAHVSQCGSPFSASCYKDENCNYLEGLIVVDFSFWFVCFIFRATECNLELLSTSTLEPSNKFHNSFVNVIQTQTCLCVSVRVLHTCGCTRTSVSMYMGTEANNTGSPQLLSILIFESGSPAEPEPYQFV